MKEKTVDIVVMVLIGILSLLITKLAIITGLM